jgi:alkanesulfonate monooxygenase SsuD/methylene tetrahydromethanopterin reductase-like flavin-dependent oxidoreductase (luciferase family)
VDVGIGLPTTIPDTEGRTLVEWARRAEEAGFSTLGTIGRLVYPNYDDLIALAAAAAVTERIRLTTSILIAPLHANSALLAKQAASLDRLSGGRLVLAVGLGGRDDDYEASGLPTTGRGRRLEELLEELKRIWSGEERGYAGAIGPTPAREGGPELIVGGVTMRQPCGAPPASAMAGSWAAVRLRCSLSWRPRLIRRGRRPGARVSRASSRLPTSRSGRGRGSRPTRT